MPKLSRAFSLIELLITLVIIGLVAAIGIPALNSARANAETETLRARAVTLQNAKLQYMNAVGHDVAQTNWTAVANNTDPLKYANLLYSYLPSSYPAALSTLIPAPFGVGLGANIDDPVTLNLSGTDIPLQKY